MNPSCREVRERLSSAQGLDPASREHEVSCPACREAGRTYAALHERFARFDALPLPRLDRKILKMARRTPSWRAAAAVLLGAGGLLAYLAYRETPLPPSSLPRTEHPGFPRVVDSSRGVVAEVLGREAALIAEAGTEAQFLSSQEIQLRRGRLLVRTAEPFRVLTPFGRCSSADGLFEVTYNTPPVSLADWLVKPSWASEEEPEGELLVVKGSVTLEISGREIPVAAGRLVQVRAGKPSAPVLMDPAALLARLAWRDGNAPWQELWTGETGDWRLSGPGTSRVLDGQLHLGVQGNAIRGMERDMPPAERFVWSVTVRRLSGGYLSILLPWSLPESGTLTLGELPQLGDGKEHVLMLRWDIAPELLLDGAVLREFPRAPLAERPRLGLGVTNGAVAVTRWQWRELP